MGSRPVLKQRRGKRLGSTERQRLMNATTPLDVLPLWALLISLLVGILLMHECGFRFGRMRGRHAEQKESDSSVGGIVAAELGLFAFLLAFSFGIAASPFDLRRQVLLDEANAIGTTYLRTAMLPEMQRAPARRLLREYVDVRLAAASGAPIDEALRRAEAIHRELWTEAVGAAGQDPRSVPTGLFIQSLNELIDLHAKRVLASLRNRCHCRSGSRSSWWRFCRSSRLVITRG
jgi:hypothetical protein